MRGRTSFFAALMVASGGYVLLYAVWGAAAFKHGWQGPRWLGITAVLAVGLCWVSAVAHLNEPRSQTNGDPIEHDPKTTPRPPTVYENTRALAKAVVAIVVICLALFVIGTVAGAILLSSLNGGTR